MRRRLQQCAGLLALILLPVQVPGQEADAFRVPVTVVDAEGRPRAGGATLIFSDVLTNQRIEFTVKTRDSVELSRGSYRAWCYGGGAASGEEYISIDEATTGFVCALMPSKLGDSLGHFPFEVRGKITPTPKRGEIIVARLISLYSTIQDTTVVDEDGAFTLKVDPLGPYKLWILRGGERVAERDVKIDFDTDRLIEMGEIELGEAANN